MQSKRSVALYAVIVSMAAAAFVTGSAHQNSATSKFETAPVKTELPRGDSDDSEKTSPRALVDAPKNVDLEPTLTVEESVVGRSFKDRPIEQIRLGSGTDVVLIMASIHGTETAGTPLVRRLIDEVKLQPSLLRGKTLVVLPMVNPDGAAAGQRYNARGVDLNRNFAAENRQNSKRYGLEALSEPEALAIFRVIEEFHPTQIVTLHEPLQCVDYDGPAKELAAAMSKVCPLTVKKLGSRPGSLGSFAGVTLKIPTITFELPKNAATQSTELLWQFYGPALLAAIEFEISD